MLTDSDKVLLIGGLTLPVWVPVVAVCLIIYALGQLILGLGFAVLFYPILKR